MTILSPQEALAATQVLARPPLPPWDQKRALMQSVRWDMLADKWDDHLSEFISTRVDEERLQSWGPPDVSVNTLADLARQYSTPGLYNSAPDLKHAHGSAELLTGPGGYLGRSGYWTRMGWVQYMTIGLGDLFLHHSLVDGEIVHRTVRPADVFLLPHPLDPGRVVQLWELRLRVDPVSGQWRYYWDTYDLGETRDDPVTGEPLQVVRPPSFRICSGQPSALGSYDDASHQFGLPEGGLVGDAYVWKTRSGKALLPYTHYRSSDSGSLWNVWDKRDAAVGTMTTAQAWTYAHASARDATGRTVLAAGITPIVSRTDGAGTAGKTTKIVLQPGAIMYHDCEQGMQPWAQEVGPGVNLADLLDYAERIEERQAVRWGLSASDLAKTGNDPASGAALLISRAAKREFADKVRPLFTTADAHTLRVCSVLLRQVGVEVPEDGYSIAYASIGQTADEQAAVRDELDWELAHGHVSPVTAYRRLHPGLSDEDARAALIQEQLSKAQYNAELKLALAAGGFAPPTPAPTSPPQTSPPDATSDTSAPESVTA